MLLSTALVLMMSVPALAPLLWRYGPLEEHAVDADAGVRRLLADHGVWCVYGYSLAFTEWQRLPSGASTAFFLKGTFDSREGRVLDGGDVLEEHAAAELVYVAFQATFARSPCA
jgi:Amt family ammonium transporter